MRGHGRRHGDERRVKQTAEIVQEYFENADGLLQAPDLFHDRAMADGTPYDYKSLPQDQDSIVLVCNAYHIACLAQRFTELKDLCDRDSVIPEMITLQADTNNWRSFLKTGQDVQIDAFCAQLFPYRPSKLVKYSTPSSVSAHRPRVNQSSSL